MNPEDASAKLNRHYEELKPVNRPEGLFELVDPVVECVLKSVGYTIAFQYREIANLRRELNDLKMQVKKKG